MALVFVPSGYCEGRHLWHFAIRIKGYPMRSVHAMVNMWPIRRILIADLQYFGVVARVIQTASSVLTWKDTALLRSVEAILGTVNKKNMAKTARQQDKDKYQSVDYR